MIAKACVFLAIVAAVRATALVGYGAPLLAGGHLGTVSAQSTAINHVAPAAPLAVGYAAGPLALGHGIAAPLGVGAPLGLGLGLGAGHGLVGGNLRADGIVGSGILGSRYGSAIAHNAVLGHGAGVAGLGYGAGVLGLGHGAGVLGLGYGAGVIGLGHGVGLGKAYL